MEAISYNNIKYSPDFAFLIAYSLNLCSLFCFNIMAIRIKNVIITLYKLKKEVINMLQVNNLTQFGDQMILDDVTFNIPQRRAHRPCGANGSSKTA